MCVPALSMFRYGPSSGLSAVDLLIQAGHPHRALARAKSRAGKLYLYEYLPAIKRPHREKADGCVGKRIGQGSPARIAHRIEDVHVDKAERVVFVSVGGEAHEPDCRAEQFADYVGNDGVRTENQPRPEQPLAPARL